MSHLLSLLFIWKGLLILFTSHSCLKEGSLFLLLLPVITLTGEQTIPGYILQSWCTSAAPFVPLKTNLYITVPPKGVLVPGQRCPTCLLACRGVFTGWLNQPNERASERYHPVPHPLSCILLLLLLCWHWHHLERSLEAGGDYRLSSLNWVTMGTSGKYQCQPPAERRNAWPEGWGSLRMQWMLAQSTNPHPVYSASVPCRCGRPRPRGRAALNWEAKPDCRLTLDNEIGDCTVWVCFPAAAAVG